MGRGSVLIVETDASVGKYLAEMLHGWGHEVVLASSAQEASDVIARQPFAFTLVDTDVPGLPGVFHRLEAQGGETGPVIVLSGDKDAERAMGVTALAADSFVHKPFGVEELEGAVRTALTRPRRTWGRRSDETARVLRETGLWRSGRMRDIWNVAQQAGRVNVTVLISGETGTGKDLVARAIHHLSPRQSKPFVKVNCAAVPIELLESELFGHERGAFTGANQLRIGRFEAADRGTVFLDEIGDLHPALQAKLLQVLQDGTFSRVGGKATMRVDVRVLAATNRDLEQAVSQGQFREDLYYRLNVIQMVVPPLRERLDEVPLLASYFAELYSRQFQREGFAISPVAMERLMRHRYPGNVRELENIVKRMVVLNDPTLSRTGFLPERPGDGVGGLAGAGQADGVSLKDISRAAARAAEREAISRVLRHTRWNRVRAAKLLGISYRALLYKIKDAGLAEEHPTARASL